MRFVFSAGTRVRQKFFQTAQLSEKLSRTIIMFCVRKHTQKKTELKLLIVNRVLLLFININSLKQ